MAAVPCYVLDVQQVTHPRDSPRGARHHLAGGGEMGCRRQHPPAGSSPLPGGLSAVEVPRGVESFLYSEEREEFSKCAHSLTVTCRLRIKFKGRSQARCEGQRDRAVPGGTGGRVGRSCGVGREDETAVRRRETVPPGAARHCPRTARTSEKAGGREK